MIMRPLTDAEIQAVFQAMGDDVEISTQKTNDGRMRYLFPKGIAPEMLERTVIYRVDQLASRATPAMYVEDLDYGEANARVSEDWRFPVIPLAASTDWVYDGSPIGDFGAGEEPKDIPGAGSESATPNEARPDSDPDFDWTADIPF